MRNIFLLIVHYQAKSLLVVFFISMVVTCSLAENVVSSEDSSGKEGTSNNEVTKNTQNIGKLPSKPSPTATVDGTTKLKDETNLKGSNNNGSLSKCNGTSKTCESEGLIKNIFKKMSDNSAMLFRTMFVLLGVTGIVIVYFVFRAFRLRRRRSKSRKYGIITKGGMGGDMEMEPLGDGNDDDEDYTVFEMNGRRK